MDTHVKYLTLLYNYTHIHVKCYSTWLCTHERSTWLDRALRSAAKPAPVQEETTRVVTSQSDLPATAMSASIEDAEEPPPPLTVEVDVTDSAGKLGPRSALPG